MLSKPIGKLFSLKFLVIIRKVFKKESADIKISSLCLFLATGSVSAYANLGSVAEPSDITVRQAVLELADTFAEVRRRSDSQEKVGLIVDEAIVEFNISASA